MARGMKRRRSVVFGKQARGTSNIRQAAIAATAVSSSAVRNRSRSRSPSHASRQASVGRLRLAPSCRSSSHSGGGESFEPHRGQVIRHPRYECRRHTHCAWGPRDCEEQEWHSWIGVWETNHFASFARSEWVMRRISAGEQRRQLLSLSAAVSVRRKSTARMF